MCPETAIVACDVREDVERDLGNMNWRRSKLRGKNVLNVHRECVLYLHHRFIENQGRIGCFSSRFHMAIYSTLLCAILLSVWCRTETLQTSLTMWAVKTLAKGPELSIDSYLCARCFCVNQFTGNEISWVVSVLNVGWLFLGGFRRPAIICHTFQRIPRAISVAKRTAKFQLPGNHHCCSIWSPFICLRHHFSTVYLKVRVQDDRNPNTLSLGLSNVPRVQFWVIADEVFGVDVLDMIVRSGDTRVNYSTWRNVVIMWLTGRWAIRHKSCSDEVCHDLQRGILYGSFLPENVITAMDSTDRPTLLSCLICCCDNLSILLRHGSLR
jgi:hypothetical protein